MGRNGDRIAMWRVVLLPVNSDAVWVGKREEDCRPDEAGKLRGCGRLRAAHSAGGRVTVNVVPSPATLDTEISPPTASRSLAVTKRPSPVPSLTDLVV